MIEFEGNMRLLHKLSTNISHNISNKKNLNKTSTAMQSKMQK